MRRAAAVDANQKELVRAFLDLGFSVALLHQVGSGVPDLLLGKHGKNFLIECKDGSKPPSARKLTPPQEKFHNEWRGQVCVIDSIEEVLAFAKSVIA